MRKLFLIAYLVIATVSIAQNQEAKKEHKEKQIVVTQVIDGAKVYGNKWTNTEEKMNIEKAIAEHEMIIGEDMVFTGNIGKVCQGSGCWMMLESNGVTARVDFNHHSFFIPKDTQGTAEVYGKLKSKMMNEKMRKHLKEDGAGDLAEKIYEIVATSVKIKS